MTDNITRQTVSEHTIWTNEGLGLAVKWHGAGTFNVYAIDHDGNDIEVEVFTRYAHDERQPPYLTNGEADVAVREWFATALEGECV